MPILNLTSVKLTVAVLLAVAVTTVLLAVAAMMLAVLTAKCFLKLSEICMPATAFVSLIKSYFGI